MEVTINPTPEQLAFARRVEDCARRGLGQREIADELGLSLNTVKAKLAAAGLQFRPTNLIGTLDGRLLSDLCDEVAA